MVRGEIANAQQMGVTGVPFFVFNGKYAVSGAQPVVPGPLALAQAPLWGLARVVSLEEPALWGGLVDLDPVGAPEDQAARLCAAAPTPRAGALRRRRVAIGARA